MTLYENALYALTLTPGEGFYTCRAACGASVRVTLPELEIDGKRTPLTAGEIRAVTQEPLAEGVREITLTVDAGAGRTLTLRFRVSDGNAVFRYSFTLSGAGTLTKQQGEYLRYLSVGACHDLTEVRLSEYDRFVHSIVPTEVPVDPRLNERIMGPILLDASPCRRLLLAYEHGSRYPDMYLAFVPGETLSVEAVKGNYYAGRSLETPFESVAFQLGVFAPDADPAVAYRDFQLRYATRNAASRRPYIFYNTWCMQERDRWYGGTPYLSHMNEARMLSDIDRAHALGVDVFVLDTGWYEMTGDWRVDRTRFPHGMERIREKLDGYGMKLGLWFSPRAAAVQSKALQGYEDCIMAWHGEKRRPYEVWETPESYDMCLVSRYWKRYADRMIALTRELGVTYFKWDAIDQYGCDSPDHEHGTAANSPEERADCYAFSLGLYMAKIVDRLAAACPEAIVDFDVTEPGRYTGLGFLSSGKYFLINNGPYYHDYNIPEQLSVRDWNNIFVYPGEARTWVCRTPLAFDRWIPSVLFLTHYLPDGDRHSVITNIASLILGQNGIWGDLTAVTPEGEALFGEMLGVYKQVREDVTEAYPVTRGKPGGSFEVHEKIASTGRGAVAVFADGAGTYEYVTASAVSGGWRVYGDLTVQREPDGCLRIRAGGNGVVFAVENETGGAAE